MSDWQIADVMNAIRHRVSLVAYLSAAYLRLPAVPRFAAYGSICSHVGSLQQDQKGEQLPVDDKSARVFYAFVIAIFAKLLFS
jgi:hypothetical protein